MEKDHEADQSELSVEASSDTEDADTESESEQQVVNVEGNEDEMTFLRGVTTPSRRTIKVTSKYF